MARKFDYRGYPVNSVQVTEHAWFYVQEDGIMVWANSKGGHAAAPAVIPWRAIKQALRDHEKAKSRRKRASNGREQDATK